MRTEELDHELLLELDLKQAIGQGSAGSVRAIG